MSHLRASCFLLLQILPISCLHQNNSDQIVGVELKNQSQHWAANGAYLNNCLLTFCISCHQNHTLAITFSQTWKSPSSQLAHLALPTSAEVELPGRLFPVDVRDVLGWRPGRCKYLWDWVTFQYNQRFVLHTCAGHLPKIINNLTFVLGALFM